MSRSTTRDVTSAYLQAGDLQYVHHAACFQSFLIPCRITHQVTHRRSAPRIVALCRVAPSILVRETCDYWNFTHSDDHVLHTHTGILENI
jgi:hypothetical protein